MIRVRLSLKTMPQAALNADGPFPDHAGNGHVQVRVFAEHRLHIVYVHGADIRIVVQGDGMVAPFFFPSQRKLTNTSPG